MIKSKYLGSLLDYNISIVTCLMPHCFASSRVSIQMSALCQYLAAMRSSTTNILLPKYSGNLTRVPIFKKLAAIMPSLEELDADFGFF